MKKLQKLTTILMTNIILFFSIFSVFSTQKVQAYSQEINKIDLFSEGEVVYFRYDGIGIGVEIIEYELDGVHHPVYCLNKGKQGVTKEHTYSVEINQLLTDMNIWRAITNGYPFKTPEELGCETIYEAYAATKMAVYDTMYHYDLDKFTPHTQENPAHIRTVNAIKQIITAARNSTESKIGAVAKVVPQNEQWQVDELDKNYVSKTYSLDTSAYNLAFEIKLTGEGSEKVTLTDINGEKRTVFYEGEKFKIKIPIKDLEDGGDFNIEVEANVRTLPIFYGESPNPDWQNFAVTMGYFETTTTGLQDKFYPNQTQIEIYKQDGDTKAPLKNATFQILDENHNILFSEITTDENGKAILNDFIPGKYYLKEVNAPNGYYGYDKEIELNVELNEKCIITIDNFALPEEEEIQKPQEEEHISASQKQEIVKLPQTGC